MPNQESGNNVGKSFSKSFRDWSNRGANTFDDALLCEDYSKQTSGSDGNDSKWMAQNGAKIRQNRLDFKLGCLAQQRAKQVTEDSMNMGLKAMDTPNH
ncbi:hypothetical protein BGZ72_000507 [Mortierella alpina]|nr:hypothetical protein BGZ72_000507 [Mortierella alpina]